MVDAFKGSRIEQFVKVPRKTPKDDLVLHPETLVWDENKWINDLYDLLRKAVEQSLDPLDDYLKCFDVYKEVLKLKPDEYLKKVENEEKPREMDAIRDEVIEFQEKERRLRESMPDSVQVGFFRVNCKEITTLLTGKYLMLSKGLIDIMAKRVKNTTLQLYDSIQEVKLKVNEPPKDIEKLTDIKEYMQQVPILLEKFR